MTFNFFKKKKATEKVDDLDAKRIYSPDINIRDVDEITRWRKPLNPNENYQKPMLQYLAFSRTVTTLLFILNISLCVMIFMGILYFMFGVDYEQAIFTDGTSLYCIMNANGSISTYTPKK